MNPDIVQISAVREGSYMGEVFSENEDATIYGLGTDGKMYFWGRTEVKTAFKKDGKVVRPAEYKFEWKLVNF